ncbi:MAG: phosphonate ABC transporter substrate-binding protein, partial [Cupriavidus sp.]|nr:phosphonate ABC transporter substrate-binding protein [Cupriavidus sp.]
KIQAFFVNYGKGTDAAHEKQVLASLTYQGFRASNDAQLVPIRQIELAREKARIESDTTLAAADREKRLSDVTRRLAELDKAAGGAVSTQ